MCYSVMLCFCLFYISVLLFGVKRLDHTRIQFPNYRRNLLELFHFSLACLPLFQYSLTLNSLDFLKFSNFSSQLLFFILLIKFHLAALTTSSYSIQLFISIPQDRLVRAIYLCPKKQCSLWFKVDQISWC